MDRYKKITIILYNLNEYSTMYFLRMSIDLKKLYTKAKNVIEESITSFKKSEGLDDSQLLKHALKGKKSIDKIIISLQYHDIIKQKLEHILTTNNEIIREYMMSEHEYGYEYKYLNALPSIARLHIGQLIQINKECQNAIENIINNLTTIMMELSAISTRALSENLNNYVLNKELQYEIKVTLDGLEHSSFFDKNVFNLINELSEIENSKKNNFENNIKEKLRIIEDTYTMKSERIIHEALFDNTTISENEVLNLIDIHNDSSIELF